MTPPTPKTGPSLSRKTLFPVLAAGAGLAVLGGTAQAQAGGQPDGFVSAGDVAGFSSVRVLADGRVELVLEDGRSIVFDADDVRLDNGQVYIAEEALRDAGLMDAPLAAEPDVTADADAGAQAGSAAGEGGGAGLALGALGGAALLGAAAGGGGGGGGGSTPTPTPTPTNSPPSFTSATTASFAENGTGTAYTATATDADGDTVTFTIAGGADGDLFSIDGSGRLTFNAPPDFEMPSDSDGDNVYEVTIRASDGTATVDRTVEITVTDVDENQAPEVTSRGGNTVFENTDEVVFTATATDPDGDPVTFSLSGTDAALFTIDATTGEVRFAAAPDFENPADADGDNRYEFNVVASDGSATDSRPVVIRVVDVDEGPAITSARTVSFDENATGIAYDGEVSGASGAVTWTLSGDDASLFTIDAATGEVRFRTSPDFEDRRDRDGDNVYEIVVNATDDSGTSSRAVDIAVNNLNDNAPSFQAPTEYEVAEGRTAPIDSIVVGDEDGDTVSFSLTGADAALFDLELVDGRYELVFRTAPDFDNPQDADGDNVYNITFVATDGTFTTTRDTQIEVIEVSGTAPVFASAATSRVSELQTSAYVADAVDPDGNDITYSISGTDAALFTVNSDTGEVTFRTAPDWENPADADGNNLYDFTITASDGSETSSQDVRVTVTNAFDTGDLPEGPSTTISMVSGGSYDGTLERNLDRDWIQVELEAGQRYQFDLVGTGANALEDPYLRLYDQNGNLIAENDDISLGTIRESQLGFTATYSGTYYISAGAYEDEDGQGYTGDYTFSFNQVDPLRFWTYQEIADYLDQNGWNGAQFNASSGDTITVDVTGLTTAGQTLARAALGAWADITGLVFREVTSNALITFDDEEEGAFAGPTTISGGFFTGAEVNVGTEWLDAYGTGFDSYSYQTYLHEIGHALGLGHGGPYNESADFEVDAIYLNDSWQSTVMSYFSQTENTAIDTNTFAFVIGPQVADILAIQQMYGTSTTTRAGDTVYGFNSNAGTLFNANSFGSPVTYAIFDAGGRDTLDFSGYSGRQTFDLREGAYSDTMGLDGNIGIALGTVIENAIGGSGADIFIGNEANNRLTGNGGNDRFYASGGNDVIDGGEGADTLYLTGAETDYTLSTNGAGNTVVRDNRADTPDGVIQLIGVESIVYNTPTPDNNENVEDTGAGSAFEVVTYDWPDVVDVSGLKPHHDHMQPLSETDLLFVRSGFASLSDRADSLLRDAVIADWQAGKDAIQDVDFDAADLTGFATLTDEPAGAGKPHPVMADQADGVPAADLPEIVMQGNGQLALPADHPEEGWL